MIVELSKAGFQGVEAENGVIHARLWSSSVDFTATPEGRFWRLALQWPLRASEAQIAQWNASHPDARMDLHQGETRVSMLCAPEDAEGLKSWAGIAELAVATCIRWRRAQRAPGEGM